MAKCARSSEALERRAHADARFPRVSSTKSSCRRFSISTPFFLFYLTLCLFPLVVADIEVTMDEEKPVNTVVTNLAEQRSIFSSVAVTQIPLMTYDILGQNSAPANYFTVERDTGVVRIARIMNREEICEARRVCKVRTADALKFFGVSSSLRLSQLGGGNNLLKVL